MADEYRLDEVFKAKMTAAARHREATREAHNVFSEEREARSRAKEPADHRAEQSFIAPSRSLMRLTIPGLRGWHRTS